MAAIGLPGRFLAFIVLLIVWALGLFFATIVFADPAPICVPNDRLQFAAVPEVVFVRGMPQTIQLGIYQIDPANPWPAGDLTRSSGWKSRFLTALVHADTAEPVEQFAYDSQTGELAYSGAWSGDLNVALVSGAGGALSKATFRIRVLTPTVVYGEGAAATNATQGWNARICPESMAFAKCRQSQFTGGNTDVAPLVIYVTPGVYAGQDWFLGARRFTYILGDPATRPTLINDELAGADKEIFYVGNLSLRNAGINYSHALEGSPNTLIIRNVTQCCETGQTNGIVNPNRTTGNDLWAVYWHSSESIGMGGTGNTRHASYVESRPTSLFDVNNVRILGTRASSAVKTTVGELNVRHSLFSVSETPGSIPQTSCLANSLSSGCLMHTPIDVPGFTKVVIYGNEFQLWRGPTVGAPVGKSGILAGAIFIRNRRESLGSDVPAYPDRSWNPPATNQTTRLSPCLQWSGEPSTFTADAFWQDVRSRPLDDPANPCTFQHFVSFNKFVQLPGSLPVTVLRDDGTFANRVVTQFGSAVDILRMHPLQVERSTSFLFGNTLVNYADGQRLYNLTTDPNVRTVDDDADPFWPRDKPEEFPRVVEVTGELPLWFRL